VAVPNPPAVPVDFLQTTWPAGEPLFRGHQRGREGNVFNPGVGKPTRFAFFRPLPRRAGPMVGALYAGASSDVAISEYLFHDLPYDVGALLPFSNVVGTCETRLIPKKDLQLAQLHDHGLRRLHVQNQQLIDTPASTYGQTVKWARAVHASSHTVHGLQWMSRQFNSQKAVVLFADRVNPADLMIDPSWDKRPYDSGPGLGDVLAAARLAGIDIPLPAP